MRAAACLLAAALVLPGALLLSAGAAEAQSTVKLVSTTGQTEDTSETFSRFINDRAQRFATGSSAGGYTLKRLDLPMSFNGITNPTAPAYTVKIHNATSSGPGSTVVGTLTNPASVVEGTNSYTTAGIDLDPNTDYWVVIDVTGTGGNHHRISNDITDGDEDAGAYAGWSITSSSLRRQFESTGAWAAEPESWMMAIHGVVKPLPPAPSGLLSNTGQTAIGGNNFGRDTAQAFTTGSDPRQADRRGPHSTESIGGHAGLHREHPGGLLGQSGQRPGDADEPGELALKRYESLRYAAPSGGIDLEANKTYWVVIDITSGANNQAFAKYDDLRRGGFGRAGGVEHREHQPPETRLVQPPHGAAISRALKIAIHGYIKSSRPTPGSGGADAVDGPTAPA